MRLTVVASPPHPASAVDRVYAPDRPYTVAERVRNRIPIDPKLAAEIALGDECDQEGDECV